MTSYIDVTFERIDRDPSIESAIHRWVARFEAMRFDVQRAVATVKLSGRRRTTVCLTLVFMDGDSRTATVTHDDAYVAVADAFRVVRHQRLDATAAARTGHASRQLIA
jgi:ribosome-associated translation inhibitor RaiA